MEKNTNRTFVLNQKIGKREKKRRKVVSRSRQDFGDLKNIFYKIAFQDNEEVNAQYVKAQNVSIDQQAQKRDEYLSYQEDMNSKLNRNEQVCIFLIF